MKQTSTLSICSSEGVSRGFKIHGAGVLIDARLNQSEAQAPLQPVGWNGIPPPHLLTPLTYQTDI